MSSACPVCNGQLVRPQRVAVCEGCYSSMQATGGVAVHTTAEFPAIAQVVAAPADTAPARRPRTPTIPESVRCSWCSKPGDSVKKVLTQNGAHICNECVALCADIMLAALGDDWRG